MVPVSRPMPCTPRTKLLAIVLLFGSGSVVVWGAEEEAAVERSADQPVLMTPAAEFPNPPQGLVTVLGDGRLKHWNDAEFLGFDATSKLAVSTSTDGTVGCWDVATGKEIRSFAMNAFRRGRGVALSGDGRTLFLAEADGSVRIIDVATGETRRTLADVARPNANLIANADGSRLVVWNFEPGEEIRVWDLIQRKLAASVPATKMRLSAVAINPEGTRLACARDVSIDVWTIGGKEPIRLWERERPHVRDNSLCMVYELAFSPDGRTLASGGACGDAHLWETDTGRKTSTFNHPSTVRGIAFSTHGTLMAISAGELVAFWPTINKTLRLRSHVSSLAFSRDASLLGLAADQTISFHDIAAEIELPNGPASDLTCIALSPDGQRLAIGRSDGNLALRSFPNLELLREWRAHEAQAWRLEFSPDGRLLASTGDDWGVAVWDSMTGQERFRVRGTTGILSAIGFTPDGTVLASKQLGRGMNLWDVATGDLRRTLAVRPRGQFAFSPDGQSLLAPDRVVANQWDVATGELRRSVGDRTLHDESPIAISPDGRYVAAGSLGRQIIIWDLIEDRTLEIAKAHSGLLRSLLFGPDGKTLLSSAEDGRVGYWNVEDGRLLKSRTIGPPGGTVADLALTPDGESLVTLNGNGTVYVLKAELP